MSENIVFRVNEFGYSAEMAEDTGANKVSWRLYTSVYTLLLEPVPRIHFIWIRILDPFLIKKMYLNPNSDPDSGHEHFCKIHGFFFYQTQNF